MLNVPGSIFCSAFVPRDSLIGYSRFSVHNPHGKIVFQNQIHCILQVFRTMVYRKRMHILLEVFPCLELLVKGYAGGVDMVKGKAFMPDSLFNAAVIDSGSPAKSLATKDAPYESAMSVPLSGAPSLP